MLEVLGDAEVAQLDGVAAREEDVLRLEVAVDDLAVVHVLDGQADLREPGQDLLLGERMAVGLGREDALAEVAALRVAHHDVEVPVLALERPQELDDEVAV